MSKTKNISEIFFQLADLYKSGHITESEKIYIKQEIMNENEDLLKQTDDVRATILQFATRFRQQKNEISEKSKNSSNEKIKINEKNKEKSPNEKKEKIEIKNPYENSDENYNELISYLYIKLYFRNWITEKLEIKQEIEKKLNKKNIEILDTKEYELLKKIKQKLDILINKNFENNDENITKNISLNFNQHIIDSYKQIKVFLEANF